MVNYLAAVLLCCISVGSEARDTLSIRLAQADSLFLTHNLALLARQYNIDAQKALIIQAKAYPNPLVTIDVNAYDPANDRYFHTGPTGQKVAAIEQLILLGGKRKTEIELAKKNVHIAELEFRDLLRDLRYRLHSGFFQLDLQLSLLRKYDQQLAVLDTLIAVYQQQADRGNVPMKDVIRLKSVYLQLHNDRSDVLRQGIEQQQQLQVLLQTNAIIIPLVSNEYFESLTRLYSIEQLQNEAFGNRPDLQQAERSAELAELNLSYQKRLAVPDISLIGSYDQRGGAFDNQINLGITLPLPVWNRNKGAIRQARFGIQISETLSGLKRQEVIAEISAAWQTMQISVSEFRKVNQLYSDDFESVIKGMNDNFQKRNVSILEFVDFFEAYMLSQAELERVKTQLALSAGLVNYTTATALY